MLNLLLVYHCGGVIVESVMSMFLDCYRFQLDFLLLLIDCGSYILYLVNTSWTALCS